MAASVELKQVGQSGANTSSFSISEWFTSLVAKVQAVWNAFCKALGESGITAAYSMGGGGWREVFAHSNTTAASSG